MSAIIDQLYAFVTGLGFLYTPAYLASAALIAAVYWYFKGEKEGLIAYLFPKKLYQHPSSRVDLYLSSINCILTGVGFFAVLYAVPTFTLLGIEVLSTLWATLWGTLWERSSVETTVAAGTLAAVLLVLTQDFCRYVTHYVHHKHPLLWPFHAVHHSAEVLTPLTFLRGHPVYYMIQQLIMSVLIGTMQAVILFCIVGQIEAWVVYTTAAVFQLYMVTGAHLRHSHVALRYPPWLEHILISPAQHQIHHSSDRRHHDKNFGEIFAFWDWIFGTLYITDGSEKLVYGLGDSQGKKIKQPYPSVRTALSRPFEQSYDAALKSDKKIVHSYDTHPAP